MTVQQDVKNTLKSFFESHDDLGRQDAYAVAVSGGPDSMALVQALYAEVLESGKIIHVLTVDHGLRMEAKREALDVASWVKTKDSDKFLHEILLWDEKNPETSIMEAARHARYKLMADYCAQHDIQTLFVAHHQDDQAETFLIRLAKGSGLDGLASMGAVQKYKEGLKIARPFLELTKQDLMDYCEAEAISFVTDSSNENTNYLRPRLRQSMQVLEEEGLSVKRLSTLARRLRRARNALEEMTDRGYKGCLKSKTETGAVLDFKQLQSKPEEVALRIIQKAIAEIRAKDDYGVRMDRLENLFESLWFAPDMFKPRTLGGLLFALREQNSALYIEKE